MLNGSRQITQSHFGNQDSGIRKRHFGIRKSHFGIRKSHFGIRNQEKSLQNPEEFLTARGIRKTAVILLSVL